MSELIGYAPQMLDYEGTPNCEHVTTRPVSPGDSSTVAPLFAVVVALYNAERYLEDTLRALQAQTFRDFEVVMVDDGSRDDTAQIARRYVQQDDRFHLIRTVNRGISLTRNTAASHSSAPWIAVCDGDDIWLPGKLAAQARFICEWPTSQRGALAALGTGGHFINAAGERYGVIDPPPVPWPGGSPDQDDSPEMNLINSSVVFRRDLFEQAGRYRAEYTPTEDLDLWLRLREHGAVVNLPEHLTLYRMHGDNFSHRSYVPMLLHAQRCYVNARRRADHLLEWDHEGYLGELRRDRPCYARTMRSLRHMMYYNMGKVHLHNGRPLLALHNLVMSGLVAPGHTARLLRHSRFVRRIMRRDRQEQTG